MRRLAALLLLLAALAGVAGAPPPAKAPPPAVKAPPPPPPSPSRTPPPVARAAAPAGGSADAGLVRAAADAALDAYLAGRFVAVAAPGGGFNLSDVLSRAQGAGIVRRPAAAAAAAGAADADGPDLSNARLGVVSFKPAAGGNLSTLQARARVRGARARASRLFAPGRTRGRPPPTACLAPRLRSRRAAPRPARSLRDTPL
jgi:hypothetical protein